MSSAALPIIPAEWSDARQSGILRQLAPALQWLAVEHLRRLQARGLKSLQLNDGWRSSADQSRLYADTASAKNAAQLGMQGLAGITAAPGHSKHELVDGNGLPAAGAYDGEPVPKTTATWATYGEEAEALGLTWGGRWSHTLPSGEVVTDRPHVELPGGMSLLAGAIAAGLVIVTGTWLIGKLRELRAAKAP